MPATLDAPTSRKSSSRERALERRVAELERENAALRAENTALKSALADFQKRFAELEARLKENSTNSHRPPSSDPPGTKRPSQREPTGRKQGAQLGHEGKTRPLVPVEQVDHVVRHLPGRCRRCHKRLRARASPSDPEPRRHQVWEIPPPPKPEITEHQAHARTCDDCGEVTQA